MLIITHTRKEFEMSEINIWVEILYIPNILSFLKSYKLCEIFETWLVSQTKSPITYFILGLVFFILFFLILLND